MTFNGTWKVDRNDNYEKFMEQMGESDAGALFGVCRFQPDFTERHCGLNVLAFLCRCAGINMVKRKLAAHDNLKITLQQDGNTFHVKESSSFRTLEMDFTLGVTFDYSLADGTELSVSKRGLKKNLLPGIRTHDHCSYVTRNCRVLQGSWSMEGEMLKGVFVRKDNGKQLTTTRIVEGDELIQVDKSQKYAGSRL